VRLMNIKSRIIAALVITAACAAFPAVAQTPKQIVVLSNGGPTDDILKTEVADKFTKQTGIPVIIRPQSEQMISSIVAQKSNPQYDLVITGVDGSRFMEVNGCLDPIDYSMIPSASHLYPIARSSHSMGMSISGVTLVYNEEKIKEAPKSWADLWDPAYKGHVIISGMPHPYGIDLMVMASKLAGGDEHNIDPGFAKLKELAPNVAAAYESSSHAAQLFQLGTAWIGPWFAGRVPPTRAAGVPVRAADPKEGQVAFVDMVSPLKGRFNASTALFMEMMLANEAQIAFAKGIGFGPARDDTVLDPALAETVTYGKDQVAKLVDFDWNYIVSQRSAWTQRFNREIVPLIGK
jgi:putative spermidine/putrescine transport system substrate-binding protein